MDANIANVTLEVQKKEREEYQYAIRRTANVPANVEWPEGKNWIEHSLRYALEIIAVIYCHFRTSFLLICIYFRKCNEVLDLYYLPTFHQFIKEIEDGYRQDGEIVRIGYKDEEFPGYSWRGYGVYSQLQDEVIIKIIFSSNSNSPQSLKRLQC